MPDNETETEEIVLDEVQELLTADAAQELIQEAKRTKNKKEVTATLAQEINEAYFQYIDSVNNVFNLALQVENSKIRLGTLLLTAKGSVGHGKFQTWLAENCPAIKSRTAVRYIGFSKACKGKALETLDDLREYQKLLIRLGLRDEPEGHGPQRLIDYDPWCVFTKSVATLRQKLTEIWEKVPLETFEAAARERMKAQLEPLVELYESL